jgi:hypothetical protein
MRTTWPRFFGCPAGSSRDDWTEMAYDRALEMLDPVWKAAYCHPATKAAIIPAIFFLAEP